MLHFTHMRTIILWGSIVGLGVVVIGGWFLLRSTPADTVSGTQSDTLTPMASSTDELPESEPVMGTSKMSDLLAMSKDLECTITHTDAATQTVSEGTLFVSDGQLRADMLVTSADVGESVLTSLINDGTTFYSWTEYAGQQMGITLAVSELTADNTTSTQANLTTEATVQYDCQVWSPVDNSVFMPPSDVTFSDFSGMMTTQMEYGTVYEGSLPIPQ